MNVLPISTIATEDERLSRRLMRRNYANAAEVLPIVRAYLVARGYQATQIDHEAFAEFNKSEWMSHGFEQLDNQTWKA